MVSPPLYWIGVAPNAPCLVDDGGADWTPTGQNDAITWPELAPLFRHRSADDLIDRQAAAAQIDVALPMPPGRYVIFAWDTEAGIAAG